MEKPFAPDYYGDFSCRASKCSDPCCAAGWEIPIDKESFEFYKKFPVDIAENTADIGGERIFLTDKNGACRYFTADGLCRLMTETGKQCEICTKYPRFFEEYDGFVETGLSLSCAAAAEIVLGRRGNPYTEIDDRKTPDRLLGFLVKARARAMERVYSGDDPDRVCLEIAGFAADLQELIDYDELERLGEAGFFAVQIFSAGDIGRLTRFVAENTEVLDPQWREMLIAEMPKNRDFAGNPEQRRNYLGYLIYRYFLKAISTEDIFNEVALITALYILAGVVGEDFRRNVQMIAREIEHNDGNLRVIRELEGR